MRHSVQFNPFRLWEDLDRDLYRLTTDRAPAVFSPAYDVTEREDHFLVAVDMPGVAKRDLKIEFRDGGLFVSGERKYGETTRRFERAFTLPDNVDTESIQAQLTDGVLHIAVPKKETMKARTIELKDGNQGFWQKLLGEKKELKEIKEEKTA